MSDFEDRLDLVELRGKLDLVELRGELAFAGKKSPVGDRTCEVFSA